MGSAPRSLDIIVHQPTKDWQDRFRMNDSLSKKTFLLWHLGLFHNANGQPWTSTSRISIWTWRLSTSGAKMCSKSCFAKGAGSVFRRFSKMGCNFQMTNCLEMCVFIGKVAFWNSAIGKATHNRVARPLQSLTPPMKHRLCVEFLIGFVLNSGIQNHKNSSQILIPKIPCDSTRRTGLMYHRQKHPSEMVVPILRNIMDHLQTFRHACTTWSPPSNEGKSHNFGHGHGWTITGCTCTKSLRNI